jgi:5'-3' exonuclease
MGIQHLYTFIKQNYPKARHVLHWNRHRGQTWGIDISSLLFRAQGHHLSFLTVIAKLIVQMRTAGIRPIVVFDGQVPEEKMRTVKKRREVRQHIAEQIQKIQEQQSHISPSSELFGLLENEILTLEQKAPNVTYEHKKHLKQFLYAAGVLFLVAEGEADDVLGYLGRTGQIQAVVSTDMDMLARRIPALIIPETADASVCTILTRKEITRMMELEYGEFVEMCVLMGTDYTEDSMSPQEAYQRVKGTAPHTVLQTVEQVIAYRILQGQRVQYMWENLLSEKQRERWAQGDPPREFDAIRTYVMENGWPWDWLRAFL